MQFSKDQLPIVATALLEYLGKNKNTAGATVLALSGDLGAGKTALVQQLAHLLGVGQVPPSPTFVIMRSYSTTNTTFSKLVHIDAYRIEEKTELAPLKLEQVFAEPNALVCIEWPEQLQGAVPEKAIQIKLISTGEDTRKVESIEAIVRALQNRLDMVQ